MSGRHYNNYSKNSRGEVILLWLAVYYATQPSHCGKFKQKFRIVVTYVKLELKFYILFSSAPTDNNKLLCNFAMNHVCAHRDVPVILHFLIKGVIEILSSNLELGGLNCSEGKIGNSTCIGRLYPSLTRGTPI